MTPYEGKVWGNCGFCALKVRFTLYPNKKESFLTSSSLGNPTWCHSAEPLGSFLLVQYCKSSIHCPTLKRMSLRILGQTTSAVGLGSSSLPEELGKRSCQGTTQLCLLWRPRPCAMPVWGFMAGLGIRDERMICQQAPDQC